MQAVKRGTNGKVDIHYFEGVKSFFLILFRDQASTSPVKKCPFLATSSPIVKEADQASLEDVQVRFTCT